MVPLRSSQYSCERTPAPESWSADHQWYRTQQGVLVVPAPAREDKNPQSKEWRLHFGDNIHQSF